MAIQLPGGGGGDGATAAAPALPFPIPPGPGDWVAPPHGSRSTQYLFTGQVSFTPLWLARGATFDAIGVDVAAAVAGGTAELGVYRSNDEQTRPGALVPGSNGVITTDTAALKQVAINVTLDSALYWLALLPLAASIGWRGVSGGSSTQWLTHSTDSVLWGGTSYCAHVSSGSSYTTLPDPAETGSIAGKAALVGLHRAA